MPTPTAYTAPEAAERAGISHRQLVRFIKANYFRAYKDGKIWVIDRQDFDQWLANGMPRVPRVETFRETAVRLMKQQRTALGLPF